MADQYLTLPVEGKDMYVSLKIHALNVKCISFFLSALQQKYHDTQLSIINLIILKINILITKYHNAYDFKYGCLVSYEFYSLP